jgi:hypothetical protein
MASLITKGQQQTPGSQQHGKGNEDPAQKKSNARKRTKTGCLSKLKHTSPTGDFTVVYMPEANLSPCQPAARGESSVMKDGQSATTASSRNGNVKGTIKESSSRSTWVLCRAPLVQQCSHQARHISWTNWLSKTGQAKERWQQSHQSPQVLNISSTNTSTILRLLEHMVMITAMATLLTRRKFPTMGTCSNPIH